MAKATVDVVPPKNGHTAKPVISKLGMDLRKIRAEMVAAGEKFLNRRELEREIANRRSGNF